MTSDAHHALRFIQPGQCYVGRGRRSLKTVLGSCVTVTFWHPQRRIGAMCHYMLPGMDSIEPDNARYAEGALRILVNRLRGFHCEPRECRVELHGGGHWQVMPDKDLVSVGERNIEEAWRLCEAYGLRVSEHDLGGHYYRSVQMNLHDGAVRAERQAWRSAAARSVVGL